MLSPYSLGKLIEWKRGYFILLFWLYIPPYSLGKLIEWKQIREEMMLRMQTKTDSLLVREINWMETTVPKPSNHHPRIPPYSLGKLIEWKQIFSIPTCLSILTSLLVREINWMETQVHIHQYAQWLHSLLVREINWMETWSEYSDPKRASAWASLLVREINWMETSCRGALGFNPLPHPPYSLGKLIEWKLKRHLTKRHSIF